MHIGRLGSAIALAVTLLCAAGANTPAAGEPALTMRVPSFGTTPFPNGSAVVVPETGHGNLEIWLQDALAEIQVSTVRVKLNDTPMATFLTINRLPRGVRVIIRLGASINPDFSLRANRDNVVSFSATDASNVEYQAQFFVQLDALTAGAKLADRAPARAPVREVAPPSQVFLPVVRITSQWPARTTGRVVTLDAEVTDREGLRRIVVELNGKAIEEVVFENELPVRRQGGFIAKSKLPGTVTGDGRKLVISIPVTLNKPLNTVGVRAVNIASLTGYADGTIESSAVK